VKGLQRVAGSIGESQHPAMLPGFFGPLRGAVSRVS
jgi:hypothetical protein